MPINTKKFKNVILYLAQSLGGKIRGKKKLAKLLYFLDFDFYEKYETSVTGSTYKHLPMGPYPSELVDILKQMEQEKSLSINLEENGSGYSPTEVFKANSEADTKSLSKEEIEILDRVVKKYGELNGTQLEQLTHAEAPYLATELNEEIPYELSYYRGTDFAEEYA